jgi:membrane protein implicated in regulation of membrane protease activity
MTVALVILAVLTVLAIVLVERRENRRDRIWREEHDRLEQYGERLAAHNGHPDGDIVAIAPARNPADR